MVGRRSSKGHGFTALERSRILTIGCRKTSESERSFQHALALSTENSQAAVNLGALLVTTGRVEEGVRWLQRGEAGVDAAQQAIVRELLNKYRPQLEKNPSKAASV